MATPIPIPIPTVTITFTPKPSPNPINLRVTELAQGGWWVVGIVVLLALVGAGMTVAILYSARYPHPTMLVLTLSIITLGLVGVYTIYGPERTDVMPLASAALGALVATLTQQKLHHPQPPPGQKEPSRKEPP